MHNPAYQHIQFIHLTSPKQTRHFLDNLRGKSVSN